MIKNYFYLAVCLIALSSVLSCSKEQAYLEVSPDTGLSFTSDGGTSVVKVSTNVKWDVSKTNTWINIYVDRDSDAINVTVGPNLSFEPRTGSITVSAPGAENVDIKVSQAALEASVTLSDDMVEVPSDGGSATIAVTAVNTEWSIDEVSAEWLEVKADTESGTIAVKAVTNFGDSSREGTFKVVAENIEPLTVKVVQGAGPSYLERSMAWRMGYRGDVMKVDRHYDFVGNDLAAVEMTDLEFDGKGNLVSFVKADGVPVKIEYDQDGRLSKVSSGGEQAGYSISFRYSGHGKYIPVYEMFEDAFEMVMPTYFSAWMPLMIRDLEWISVRDANVADNNLDYHYNVEGDSARLDVYYESGDVFWEDYYSIQFKGVFPSVLESGGEKYAEYEVADSGHIVSRKLISYVNVSVCHNIDARNTVASFAFGQSEAVFGYNEYLDVVSRAVSGEENTEMEAEYTYDGSGNWISAKIVSDGMEDTVYRKITYR